MMTRGCRWLWSGVAVMGLVVVGCIPPSAPLPQSGGGATTILPAGTPQSGTTDPETSTALVGLYLGQFEGSVDGSAFMEVRASSAVGRFLITTIEGAGFDVALDVAGGVTVLGMNNELAASASGTGEVFGTDSFVFTATVTGSAAFPDGTVSVEASRLAGTDASFPLSVTPSSSTVFLNQVFSGTVTTRDPISGLETTLTGQQITIQSDGAGATIQLPSQTDYTAVFYEPLRGAFRVVEGGSGAYGTLSGSGTSWDRDVLGRIDFVDITQFTGILAIQTRGALGTQTQSVVSISVGG